MRIRMAASMAAAAAAGIAAVALADDPGPDGMALYEKQCAKCHGPTGAADTPAGKALKVESLVTPEWASEEAVPRIEKAVREGVPRMPAMDSKLTPAEIEAVARATQQLVAKGLE